jgi:hypothetical protein
METPVKTITMVKCSNPECSIKVKKPDGFKGNNLLCPEHRPKKATVEKTPVVEITMVKCSNPECSIKVKKPDGFKGNNLLCPEHRPKKVVVEKTPIAESVVVEKTPIAESVVVEKTPMSGKKIISTPILFRDTADHPANNFTAFLNTLNKSSQNFIVNHFRKEVSATEKKIIASPTSFSGTGDQHAELNKFTDFLNTLDKSSQNFIVNHFRNEVPRPENKAKSESK